MKIYIMRHGETYWNKQGLIQGSSDIELTPYGISLAEQTRDGFADRGIKFDKIFTSPYKRAQKTAQTISEKQNCAVITDSRIREMCFGIYEGQNIKSLCDTDPNVKYCFSVPSKYKAPEGGESFEELFARMEDFFEKEIVPLEKSCENVLIVCHGAFIHSVLIHFSHQDLDEFWSIYQPNCCVNLLSLENGEISVEETGILFYTPADDRKRSIL